MGAIPSLPQIAPLLDHLCDPKRDQVHQSSRPYPRVASWGAEAQMRSLGRSRPKRKAPGLRRGLFVLLSSLLMQPASFSRPETFGLHEQEFILAWIELIFQSLVFRPLIQSFSFWIKMSIPNTRQ